MIGLDAVDISRFKHWSKYPIKQLEKVFHIDEIQYALSNPNKTAERFAARFAAKEAFYKALSAVIDKKYSLLSVFRNVRVAHMENGVPFLIVNLKAFDFNHNYSLTITHTDKTAIALVMITLKPNH